jgi:hypothetical protein
VLLHEAVQEQHIYAIGLVGFINHTFWCHTKRCDPKLGDEVGRELGTEELVDRRDEVTEERGMRHVDKASPICQYSDYCRSPWCTQSVIASTRE